LKSLSDLIDQVGQYLPHSLLEELEYVGGRFERGLESEERIGALIDDVVIYLEEGQRGAPIARQRIGSDFIIPLNVIEEEPIPFALTDEPTEEGFYNTHHDIISPVETYRPDDPLEQRGRLYRPLYLDRYPDFLFNEYKTLGVDAAGSGADQAVLLNQHGGHVTDIQGYYKQDVTGEVINNINEHNPQEIIIDMTGGWGADLYKGLIDMELDALCVITAVHFNQAPRDETLNAANARAEMYLNLQRLFRFGMITLPPHKKLVEELTWIKYHPSPVDGKLRIEEKIKCKKRNKRSPDYADALALAFYFSGGLELY
jgi:hypothetical protein